MTAIRSVRAAEGKFVQISNAAARDRRLSLRARGVLLFVLSLPPEQHFTAKWLETQVPEGREAVRSALRELIAYGYMRRQQTSRDGTWVWEQVISDAPLAAEQDDASPQVEPCDGNPYDGKPSDGNPSDKELNTDNPNTEKMVRGRASRRAHASGERATRTVDQVIREIREGVAQVLGQQQADDLYDDDALGLYFRYVTARARDVPAYIAGVIERGGIDHIDTLLSNSTPVCVACVQYDSNCHCPAAA